MDEEWILNRVNNGQILTKSDIYNLKTQFGVSWEAMINRLDEIGVQSKSVTHGIFAERRQSISNNTSVVEVDENFRYISCPECRNADFSNEASYCKICGTYLFNDCTNLGCGKHNAPDARYCEYCGAETILFQVGLLRKKSDQARGCREASAHYDPGDKRKIPELRIIRNGTAKKGGFGI